MLPGSRRKANVFHTIGTAHAEMTRLLPGLDRAKPILRRDRMVKLLPNAEHANPPSSQETSQSSTSNPWVSGIIPLFIVTALIVLADCSKRGESTVEDRTDNAPDIGEEAKQKFKVGQEEEKEEDKICNWNLRFSWCSEEVSKMAEAGLFDDAVKATRTIEDSDKRSDCLIKTASELAEAALDKTVKADLFREITEAARTIEDLFVRSKTLSEIASEMAKAGLDKTEVNKVFQSATDAAKVVGGSECCGWGTRARALCIVASNKAEAGLFNDALMVARTIGVPWEKSMAFSEIAAEMAKAGWDKAEVSKAFQSAIDAAMAMQEDSFLVMNRPYALVVAVSGMVEAGLDKAELRKALQLYIKVLATAENQRILSAHPEQKGWVLDFIYSAGGKAGLNVDEVNKMLKDAGFSRVLD